jgi:cytochrome c peroxidase
MASLEPPPSPYTDGRAAVERGAAVFGSLNCDTCHPPPLYTDRQLHDVGTGHPLLEQNAHGRGTTFDTPSLRAVWLTAPYFHDGSAATLKDVLNTGPAHQVFDRLSPDQFDDLASFLLALPTE